MQNSNFLTVPEYSKKYGVTRARIYQITKRLICRYDKRGTIIEDSPANLMYLKSAPQRLELIALVNAKYDGGASIGEISKEVELDAGRIEAIVDGLIK